MRWWIGVDLGATFEKFAGKKWIFRVLVQYWAYITVDNGVVFHMFWFHFLFQWLIRAFFRVIWTENQFMKSFLITSFATCRPDVTPEILTVSKIKSKKLQVFEKKSFNDRSQCAMFDGWETFRNICRITKQFWEGVISSQKFEENFTWGIDTWNDNKLIETENSVLLCRVSPPFSRHQVNIEFTFFQCILSFTLSIGFLRIIGRNLFSTISNLSRPTTELGEGFKTNAGFRWISVFSRRFRLLFWNLQSLLWSCIALLHLSFLFSNVSNILLSTSKLFSSWH